MEAVGFVIPAAVSVPKLMASEGFGGARVSGSGSQGRESDCVSVFVGSKPQKCSGLSFGHKDLSGPLHASEQFPYIKNTDTELYRSCSKLPRLPKDDLSREQNYGRNGNIMVLNGGTEEKQLHGKAGKVPKNGNGCSKRPKVIQLDQQMPQAEVSDTNAASDKLGPTLMKCLNAEKNQTMRTKSNLNSKRGDRRNCRVPVKTKCDSGSLSFNLASGGNGALVGMYGLKPDVHDVTHNLDDISLNDLLDGSYKCPVYGKDKGKKTANINDNILHSVRRAFSILQIRGPFQAKQTEDIGSSLHKKASMSSSTSCSSAAISIPPEEDHHAPDLNSGEIEIQAQAPADLSMQPKDILDCLVHSAPKDLESLLQDVARGAPPSRCSDSHSIRATSYQISLPPFPWSHNYNGNCKSSSDAAKLACKSVCVGRWIKIANISSFLGGRSECYGDVDSLTYDSSIVPPGELKYIIPETGSTTSVPSLPRNDQASSSGMCQAAFLSPCESGSNVECKVNAPHSPRALVAAQTLWDIVGHKLTQDPNGAKWPKRQSQKTMKARKFTHSEKPEDLSSPKPGMTYNDLSRSMGHPNPFKKPKLPMIEKKEDFGHVSSTRGPSYWSAPRSSRPSPIRLPRDTVAEGRNNNANYGRQPLVIPLPPRVVDKSNHSQQKVRKVMPMDWSWTKN